MDSVNSTQTSQNMESELEINRLTPEGIIDGELLDDDPQEQANSSALATNFHQNESQALVTDWFEIEESIAVCPDYINTVKRGLDFLLTPYRLATIGVLVLANGLLAGHYLMQLNQQKLAEPAKSEIQSLSSVSPATDSTILPSQNLTSKNSQLKLSSLSTLSVQSPKATQRQSTTIPPKVVASRPSTHPSQLSQSLMPYIVAPPIQQPVQTQPALPAPAVSPQQNPAHFYIQAPTPTVDSTHGNQPNKTQSVPVLAPAPAIPLVQNINLSGTTPPETLTPEELAKQSIIREDLDRIRLERENIPPLGFNHEYRMKMKSLRTGEDIRQLRSRHYQLQQQAIPTTLE